MQHTETPLEKLAQVNRETAALCPLDTYYLATLPGDVPNT